MIIFDYVWVYLYSQLSTWDRACSERRVWGYALYNLMHFRHSAPSRMHRTKFSSIGNILALIWPVSSLIKGPQCRSLSIVFLTKLNNPQREEVFTTTVRSVFYNVKMYNNVVCLCVNTNKRKFCFDTKAHVFFFFFHVVVGFFFVCSFQTI